MKSNNLLFLLAFSFFFISNLTNNTLFAQTPLLSSKVIHGFPAPMDDPSFPFVQVTIDESTPEWAKLLYEPNPNIHKIQDLQVAWRKKNWTVKNGHTQNYKKLIGYLFENDLVSEAGFIEMPTYETTKAINDKLLKDRAKFQRQERPSNARNSNNTAWQLIGPAAMNDINGEPENEQINIYSITQSLSNLNILYSVSETGGTIFKTTDNGNNWFSVSDDLIKDMGARNIEVAPSNPDIVYLCIKHEILKTTDGGGTWNSVYYEWNSKNLTHIIHPTNPDIVLAGGANGILKSTDGGANWTNPLAGKTVYDLRYRPGSSEMIYALVDNPTTNQTDFYKSIDGGNTWTVKTTGWPTAASTSNTGGQMTTCDAYDHIVYVFIGASWEGTTDKNRIKILKSSDYGETWTLKVDYDNEKGINSGQGYYDWDIEMSDADTNIIALGTQGSWITYDDFATVTADMRHGWSGHEDIQEMLFNGNEIWVANDGGIIKYENDSLYNFDVKMNGVNAMSYWSFDQGWNKDVQIGTHYHNGTSGLHEDYTDLTGVAFGGAEPSFSLVAQPNAERIVSKGYGSVNGYHFPTDPTSDFDRFSYNLTPNNYRFNGTNICTHPLYYNTHYAGYLNKLMYSEDFGVTWDTLYSFPANTDADVRVIEIPRANTNTIYVTTRKGKLYKSLDAGQSFVEITIPAGAASVDYLQLSISQEDENLIYIGGDGDNPRVKIYKSEDGGANWVDLWTSTLDDYRGRRIFHPSGTDGGIYVMTTRGTFYRNNTLTDWQLLSNGMPANTDYRFIRPFYRDDALRIATSRGVYGAELYDTPQLTDELLQPTVQQKEYSCARDTLYFEDFSVVAHDGATWSWSFPGANYVSATNVRNPKVVYGNGGEFHVTMSITKGGQTYSKTIEKMVDISDACSVIDTIPGQALLFNRSTSDRALIDDLDLTTNTFTFTAWMKPTGSFNAFQGIFSNGVWCAHCNDETLGLIINYWGDRLYYRWPGSTSSWGSASNLYPTLDEWSYVAFVMSPDKVTLYLNDEKWESTISHAPANIQQLYLGFGHYTKYFNGQLDEVTMWKRSLNDSEIKELMHLTKDPTSDPDLLTYYQFNEADGDILDKAGIKNATLLNNTTRVPSTIPVGGGFSTTQTESIGNISFTNTDVDIEFTTQNGAEVVVSKINLAPNTIPTGLGRVFDSQYWAIHRYGTGSFAGNITFKVAEDLTDSDEASPDDVLLYGRNFNSDTDWTLVDIASSVDAGNDKATFDNISNFDQFLIVSSSDGVAEPMDCIPDIVYENRNDLPSLNSSTTYIKAGDINGSGEVVIESGQTVLFRAKEYIELKPGFSVKAGADFTARIEDCAAGLVEEKAATARNAPEIIKPELKTALDMNVYPNPFETRFFIDYRINKTAQVTIQLFDLSGKKVRDIMVDKRKKAGTYKARFTNRNLTVGTYVLVIQIDKEIHQRKVVLSSQE